MLFVCNLVLMITVYYLMNLILLRQVPDIRVALYKRTQLCDHTITQHQEQFFTTVVHVYYSLGGIPMVCFHPLPDLTVPDAPAIFAC